MDSKRWWQSKKFNIASASPWAWFKLFVVKITHGEKVGIDCSRNSKESELSYSTYCGYIGIDSIRRHGRYPFYQKHCGHWEKQSSKFKGLQKISFKKL